MAETPEPISSPPDQLSSVLDWFRRVRPGKVLAIALSVGAISSAIATWIAMTGSENPLGLESSTLNVLVFVNLALLIVLASVIGRRMFGLWKAMKQGSIGSRLQTRMVLIFSLVTIIPTIIVSVFSAIFFHIGIKTWFDERVQIAIEESVAVAESYLEEHKETIRADALAMGNDFKRNLAVTAGNPSGLSQILEGQAALRNLSEAIVFQPSRVVARTGLSFSLTFERLPQHVMERADEGNVVIMTDDEDKIRALIKIDDYTDMYLMIGRIIDPKVLNHMVVAQGAVSEYRRLQKDIASIQIHFSLLFVLVAMLLLLAAIWYGMYLALRLVIPITRLIHAAEKVRAGDFSAQVPESKKQDELNTLGRTFNKMTQQLEKQRQELVAANRQLDERRRFTEAVFAGVSAGVVALDEGRVILLNNRTAAQLLQDDESQSMKGMPITALIPDIAELLEKAEAKPDDLAETHLTIERLGKKLNLHVRVTAEMKDSDIEGFIVTFDDITELVSAQRSAAWADVARRIAHEIKNPLTPITLSAERLRKKYKAQLEGEDEQEAFQRYVDTITKHVKDIGQMVEEFVSFARMPTPTISEHNICQTIKEAVFSSKTAHGKIKYSHELPNEKVMLKYDERQISQALTNLLKNAAEALEAKQEEEKDFKPQISVRLDEGKTNLRVIIEDNGNGFPPDQIDKLTEPYVTTRAKGTGLGLAIVKKHMEEHKGSLKLQNRDSGGARVILAFPQS